MLATCLPASKSAACELKHIVQREGQSDLKPDLKPYIPVHCLENAPRLKNILTQAMTFSLTHQKLTESGLVFI